MKPSVRIEGDLVYVTTPEGQEVSMKLEDVLERASPRGMDTRGVALPNGTKFLYSDGPVTVWVYETPPRVVQLKWLAADSPVPFGRGAKYRMVRIAMPYLVVLAAFEHGLLTDYNECFFRVAPTDDESDELLYPALLNCSRFEPPDGKPLSWVCTQHLDRSFMNERDPKKRMRLGFQSLVHCLIETGYNRSSDVHEHSSWYTESTRVDKRISTIEKWQEATEHDWSFVLDVPWLKTGESVKAVVDRIFRNHSGEHRVRSAPDLARLILNHAKSK